VLCVVRVSLNVVAILDEDWQSARRDKDTRLHLIKPLSLELDVDKCIYSDDSVLPA
jgi:hypothetical protein